MIYFIEQGYVRRVSALADGRQCTLDLHAAGDVFGELALAGTVERFETAIAMENSVLYAVQASDLLAHLRSGTSADFAGFLVRFLAARSAEQQQAISNLLTANSEQRLGAMLLRLARKFGRAEARGIRISRKLSHQDLSELVGTTRPRITTFLQRFRAAGIVHTTSGHSLIVNLPALTSYLEGSAEKKQGAVQY